MSLQPFNHSFVIAYGKRKTALRACITSIRRYNDVSEIVVVDMYADAPDLSGLNVRYVPLGYPPHEVFWKSQCLNRGVQEARGDYCSILDCDMIVPQTWHTTIRNSVDSSRVVVTPVFMQPPYQTKQLLAGLLSPDRFMASRGVHNKTGLSQITLLRKHLLANPYNTRFRGYGAEDSEINERLKKSLTFTTLPKSAGFSHLYHPRKDMGQMYFGKLQRNRALYYSLLRNHAPRIGIYVASHHASRVLPLHLEAIAKFTQSPFDYYICDNSSNDEEKQKFTDIVSAFSFPTVMNTPTSDHGDSLQSMVEQTKNDIIVLFDVDAFPLKPWDTWALACLKNKEVVAILSHVERREVNYFLHPSFMVFHRSFLFDNNLDLRPGRIDKRRTTKLPWLDPAGKITLFLEKINRFHPDYVEALLPTHVEVPFEKPFSWHDTKELRRGFGVTYADTIFHFWFNRHLYSRKPIQDDSGRTVVTSRAMTEILTTYRTRIHKAPAPARSTPVDAAVVSPRPHRTIRKKITHPKRVLHMPEKTPRIQMMMLTFNRHEYTRMTLESLVSVDCGVSWDDIEFTIIDHNSSDKTREVIESFTTSHPGIITHFLPETCNRGAAGGLGHYLRTRPQRAPFICKIDNDSIFTVHWLKKLLLALEPHADLAVVGAQESPGQGKNDKAVVDKNGYGYYPARFVGGRFLARSQALLSRSLTGNGVWGWTDYQTRKLRGWKIGWCIPDAVIEHVGDWNFRHAKAIRNEEYREYFRVTGRLKGVREVQGTQ